MAMSYHKELLKSPFHCAHTAGVPTVIIRCPAYCCDGTNALNSEIEDQNILLETHKNSAIQCHRSASGNIPDSRVIVNANSWSNLHPPAGTSQAVVGIAQASHPVGLETTEITERPVFITSHLFFDLRALDIRDFCMRRFRGDRVNRLWVLPSFVRPQPFGFGTSAMVLVGVCCLLTWLLKHLICIVDTSPRPGGQSGVCTLTSFSSSAVSCICGTGTDTTLRVRGADVRQVVCIAVRQVHS